MVTIAVLITCHNRKFKTLECLYNLYTQQGIFTEFNLDVFLVDDASSDGTSEEVRKLFPTVNIIKGSGNLYWNRGMYLAWKNATEKSIFDYYLWLNDDTYLFSNAIKSLLGECTSDIIMCGATQSSESKLTTYGGYLNHKLLDPADIVQEIDYFNGNCVLIPFYVYSKIGKLDPFFDHALGDFDYGRRAKKNQIKLFLSTKYIGFCENHNTIPIWLDTKYPLLKRAKYLYSPKSGCNPYKFYVADYRTNGHFVALFHFITIHITLLFPIISKK